MSTFVKQGNQWVVKEGISENSSINDCLLALGYNHNQFYSYTNYILPYSYDENGDNILNVCLKVMTEDIICVMTSPGRKSLTDADVQHYMQDFDYSLEYSLYSMESDLDSAIDEHNYTIQFVADTLGIPYSPDDKVLYSSKLKYNFIFDGGYLVGYEIADGLNYMPVIIMDLMTKQFLMKSIFNLKHFTIYQVVCRTNFCLSSQMLMVRIISRCC